MTIGVEGGSNPLLRLTYQYDRMGNPLQISDQDSGTQSYSYDPFGRIGQQVENCSTKPSPMTRLETFFEMTAFGMAPWRSLQERTG